MYLNKFVSIAPSVVGPFDLSSGSVLVYFVAPVKMRVKEIQAMVTTALVSTGSVVCTFYRRPTHGSASGEVSIGVLTIPQPTAVGQTIYKDVAGVSINAGEEIVVKLTTAASTSGNGIFNFVADEDPEVVANQSNMIASA